MLRLNDQPDQVVPVVHHGARDGPVGPLAVGGLDDVHAVGLDVLPAIGLVEGQGGELGEVELGGGQAEVLAGAG